MTAASEAATLKSIARRPRPPHWGRLGVHALLLAYTCIALGPVLLVVANSMKSSVEIFGHPFSLPKPSTLDFVGYQTVHDTSHFDVYFRNSLIVTVVSVFAVLALSALAAFGLTEYQFPGNTLLAVFFAIGIMIPIRLGTVSLLKLMSNLGLVNHLLSLILVYTAMGIPLGVFLISQFMRQVPRDLKAAARVDGANEFQVFGLTIPLVRHGLAAVAVFTMLPVWNDLWFPLILAPDEKTRTVTLGAQQFLGQYASDWNAVLAALTLAMVPILLLYIIFSRQFLRGLTEGALK